MGEILGTALEMWDWLMSHLILINLVLSVIIVFFQRRDPKAVWTWLLALYFVPVFGFLFYLLLCQDLHKSKMFRIKEVEDKLASSGGGSSVQPSGGASYQVVNLSAGQTITGGAACEFLLRSGTATCVSDTSPGLVDMTAGTTLAGGGALTANHLYLATIEGRGVKASTAVTLLVRGTYSIQ